MGFVVVSPCLDTAADAASYAATLPQGYQIVGCTAASGFVELTAEQKVQMFMDGLTMGGLIALAMVAAWSITILRRLL